MRNPLSAIIQCSDSCIESLRHISDLCERGWLPSTPVAPIIDKDTIREEIKACLDALETIIFCSLHQKRVSTSRILHIMKDAQIIRLSMTFLHCQSWTPISFLSHLSEFSLLESHRRVLKLCLSNVQRMTLDFSFEKTLPF
jgi:hypothetical protein